MKTNLLKLIIFTLLVSLKSLILFSQKAIVSEGDTLICFTPVQCKIILKEFARLNFLDSLTTIQNSEIEILQLSATDLNAIISIQKEQIQMNKNQSKLKDIQIETFEGKIVLLKKEIRKQKALKICSIIGGSITTGFMTYLWISK